MQKNLILLDTIAELSASISQQQHYINLENLVNPQQLGVANFWDPVDMDVSQPITLYHFASAKRVNAISRSIEKWMTDQHYPLPANWTYSQLAKDIIGEPAGDHLVHLCDVLKDLTLYGY